MNVCLDPSCDEAEIQEQLENLNVNKSTGVDRVHP